MLCDGYGTSYLYCEGGGIVARSMELGQVWLSEIAGTRLRRPL